MRHLPTTAKLAGLAFATVIGFAIGNSGEPKLDTVAAVRSVEQTDNSLPGRSVSGSGSGSGSSSSASALSKRLRFAQHVATCDPRLFPDLLLDELETGNPNERLSLILETWVERDREGHATWLETQPQFLPFGFSSSATLYLHGTLLHALGEEDPAKALAMAKHLRTNERSQWQILESTLEKDPVKALELAQAHPDIYTRSNLYFPSDGSGPDPMLALPVLKTLYPGAGRAALVGDGSEYYASHPEEIGAAEQWFQQLPPDAQRSVVNQLERGRFSSPKSNAARPKLKEIWKLPATE